MVIKNLQFFNSNGYNLNFDWNDSGYWEGTIYLPKVSVGLYVNTSIYVLEKVENGGDSPIFNNSLSFPTGDGKIIFRWDSINKFVDEFFMFDFDETYTLTETSALVYTPNDGPDCNTLIINRFDEYEIPIDNTFSSKALPIHIAFMAHERYDGTTYNRTLVMYHNDTVIARIKFYAETVEEDERLKIWNHNLGYNITPEDTMIFYKSDIKEYMPDYMLLNEKRKELMMEGSNIYPYIGSYKAIINAIKFFGYENLNIIEYWRNVNPDDENFGKIYHSSKYSLKHKETLRIGTRNIVLPNKDYKKINALALVYSINKPTGEVDDWDLPEVKEQFTYTIEEALIKLFALRKKLNKEFMPGTSRIIDIIGEANYFGLQGITKISDFSYIEEPDRVLKLDFDVEPSKYVHITDNEYFNRYINIIKNTNLENVPVGKRFISDLTNFTVNDIINEYPRLTNPQQTIYGTLRTNNDRCDYYREYYREAFVDYTIYKAIQNNDDYSFENEEYDYYTSTGYPRFSAKVILRCNMFEDATFDNCELKFNCKRTIITTPGQDPIQDNGTYNVTFDNINDFNNPDKISWKINMSAPDDETGEYQIDDDAKNIGTIKKYKPKSFEQSLTNENMTQYGQWFVELPYVGYYDVTMTINGQKKTKKKCIKVEPYNIDVIGFYYDARELPKNMKYENPEDSVMYNFIQDNINNMTGWAVSERTNITEPTEFSMPTYTYLGEMINTGPYYNENIDDEWYLADNLTYEMSKLKPIVKYTRYIKSGVDVKPYTWFLLGYEYSKIAGKVNPVWTIKNNTEGGEPKEFKGRFLTMLLKKEGNYTVTLTLEDKNGNTYNTSRNIIVVNKSANYKLYQTFKKEYDYMTEENLIRELNDIYYNVNEEGQGD